MNGGRKGRGAENECEAKKGKWERDGDGRGEEG